MRTIILAIAAMFVLALGAQAQDRPQGQLPSKEELAQRITDMLAEQLELTAEQKEAVLALNLQQLETTMAQVPQDGPATLEARPDVSEAMEAAQAAYTTALKEILTEEQYSKFEGLAKNIPMPGMPRHGGPRGKGPGAPGEEMRGPAPAPAGGCAPAPACCKDKKECCEKNEACCEKKCDKQDAAE